ncbi:MAG: right-handed parallel beta-helix repeat-containing protein [Acidobacteriota bacterium]|nr:right-handed parallel beta-helix repeat-containing protein [Acidobacteriota bacterium]
MGRISYFLILLPLAAAAQQYGRPPAPGLGAIDVISAFRLPALRDTSDNPVEAIVAGLQVGRRATALGLTGKSPVEAWNGAQTLLASGPMPVTRRVLTQNGQVIFSGATASALNQLLLAPDSTNIKVTSAAIAIDQPIEIQRSGVTLDLGSAQLVSTSPSYMVRIERANNVTLLHGDFIRGDSAILVNASTGITIEGLQISGLTGAGIIVTGSTHVVVSGSQISGLGLAGIMLHRGTTQSIVQGNVVSGNVGAGNLMAGIVLTDREVDLTASPRAIFGPDGYFGIVQPMMQRLNPPHDNLVVANQVLRNNSSGIYSDGAVRNVIASNTIQSNAKEGLCLDNGSGANVVASNIIQDNGNRWGETDALLALEFILPGGRLADGTPVEKVSGISIDNARLRQQRFA